MNWTQIIIALSGLGGGFFAIIKLGMNNKKEEKNTAIKVLQDMMKDLQETVGKLEVKVEKLEKEKRDQSELILELREQKALLISENTALKQELLSLKANAKRVEVEQ